ncbi:hypothetical protein M3Y95_00449300 [Aphelenchoides besseyi]|nr:hypothetical protein M3Y95_00449300 [Aphelenchoides besseyi]
MKRSFAQTQHKDRLTLLNKQLLLCYYKDLKARTAGNYCIPFFWNLITVSRSYFAVFSPFDVDTKIVISNSTLEIRNKLSTSLCRFFGNFVFHFDYQDFGLTILKLSRPGTVDIQCYGNWETATKVAAILREKEDLKKIKVDLSLYHKQNIGHDIEFIGQLPDKIVEIDAFIHVVHSLENRECQLTNVCWSSCNRRDNAVCDQFVNSTIAHILSRAVQLNAKCISFEEMEFENFGLTDISTENESLEVLKFPIKLSDWDTYDRRSVPNEYDVHESKWKNDNDKNFRKALENIKRLSGNRAILSLTDNRTVINQIPNVNYLVNSIGQMIKNAQYLLDVADELEVEVREINVEPEIRISLDDGNEQWMKKCDDTLKREFGLPLFNEEKRSIVLENEKRTQLTLSYGLGGGGKKQIQQKSNKILILESGDDYTGSECEYRRSNYGSGSDEDFE